MSALAPAVSAAPDGPLDNTIELLGDGRTIEIRPYQPDDRDGLLAALARVSDESMRRRFFGPRRSFSSAEISFFTSVDFVRHFALVAVASSEGHPEIIGGCRYIVVEPGSAEIAFCIVDAYQSQGVGTALMNHLVAAARHAGLKQLVAEILPENGAMFNLCAHAGPCISSHREAGCVHVTLAL